MSDSKIKKGLKLNLISHANIGCMDKVYQANITTLKHYLSNTFIKSGETTAGDEPLQSRPTNPEGQVFSKV